MFSLEIKVDEDPGLPNDRKRFFLIGKSGKFWDRPFPVGVRSGS